MGSMWLKWAVVESHPGYESSKVFGFLRLVVREFRVPLECPTMALTSEFKDRTNTNAVFDVQQRD